MLCPEAERTLEGIGSMPWLDQRVRDRQNRPFSQMREDRLISPPPRRNELLLAFSAFHPCPDIPWRDNEPAFTGWTEDTLLPAIPAFLRRV
jgi:hypothetical protein